MAINFIEMDTDVLVVGGGVNVGSGEMLGVFTCMFVHPEEAALRDAHERGRDYEQSRWLYEFLQRSYIREWNGHPPEPRR